MESENKNILESLNHNAEEIANYFLKNDNELRLTLNQLIAYLKEKLHEPQIKNYELFRECKVMADELIIEEFNKLSLPNSIKNLLKKFKDQKFPMPTLASYRNSVAEYANVNDFITEPLSITEALDYSSNFIIYLVGQSNNIKSITLIDSNLIIIVNDIAKIENISPFLSKIYKIKDFDDIDKNLNNRWEREKLILEDIKKKINIKAIKIPKFYLSNFSIETNETESNKIIVELLSQDSLINQKNLISLKDLLLKIKIETSLQKLTSKTIENQIIESNNLKKFLVLKEIEQDLKLINLHSKVGKIIWTLTNDIVIKNLSQKIFDRNFNKILQTFNQNGVLNFYNFIDKIRCYLQLKIAEEITSNIKSEVKKYLIKQNDTIN